MKLGVGETQTFLHLAVFMTATNNFILGASRLGAAQLHIRLLLPTATLQSLLYI